LCDITLRQLFSPPLCKLTYFEQRFIDDIHLNIPKAIGSNAESDVLLTAPKAFPKKLKLALVTTLSNVMTGTDEIRGVEVMKI
jgi:hypothetical protein